MNYRCQKGCTVVTRSGNRKPMWHARKSDCPYEAEYRGPATTAPAPSGTAAPAGMPAPVRTEVPAPSPAAPRKGVGILSFGTRPAETTTRVSPAAPMVQPEFEVDSDHALSLFELFDNIILRAIHFGDRLLGVKEYEGRILLHSVADEELVKKKMGRRIATTITKGLGATTQEEAHGIIESGGVLVLIGGGFMSVGSHFWVAWRPAIRDKVAAAREKRKANVEFPAPAGAEVPALPAPKP